MIVSLGKENREARLEREEKILEQPKVDLKSAGFRKRASKIYFMNIAKADKKVEKHRQMDQKYRFYK